MKTDCSGYYIYDAWIASACMPSSLMLQLLEIYGNPYGVYMAIQRNDKELQSIIPKRFQFLLRQNASEEFLKTMEIKMEKYAIRVVRYGNPEYPSGLTEIQEPPALLFYQGNLSCLNRRILAIVGSRAASYIGQKATINLAEKLSIRGVSVVSGMACGIDAAAHQGCIKGRSPTIAVTGCGLDRVYPSDHQSLRDSILNNGGLLLSEYAPGEKPAGWHFPVRNRVIAGVSHALIIMEARIRSGSMTSVRHALDQGKDVFVYPGDPASDFFEGNHQLLREGGIYFTDADDILEDLHWLDNPTPVRQNIDCPAAYGTLSGNEKLIAEALGPGSLSFEELLASTGLDPSAILSTLTLLQIKGIVEALPGKKYQLKH